MMWSRRTESRLRGRRRAVLKAPAVLYAELVGALLAVAACGGREAWLHDPLPERGPVVAPAPLPAHAPRVRLTAVVGDIVVAL